MSSTPAFDAPEEDLPGGQPAAMEADGETLIHSLTATDQNTPVFEAVIAPHRSLSRRGSLTLTLGLIGASGMIGVRIWFMGAWPVLLFSGLELWLALFLLALNRHRAKAREVIKLSQTAITVVQTDAQGRRRSFSLPSAWLQIQLEMRDNCSPRLLLRSHGRGREVGAFLHEPEKRSLFEALRDALHDVRQPRFDNQQLREG